MGYVMELRKILGSRPLIVPGAGVILINERNEILLGKRTDNGFWDYPAGSMEMGESFEECARREVKEETGLLCGKLDILMEVSGEDCFYEYPNGDQVYSAGLIFVCREYAGEMKVQAEEVSEQRFFPIDALPEDLAPLESKARIFRKVREYLLTQSGN